jgi:hypothetical protein
VDLQGAGEEYSCGVEEELWPHRVVVAIHDDDVLVPGIAVVDLLTAEWRGGGRAGRMGRKVRSECVREGLLTYGMEERSRLAGRPQTVPGYNICRRVRLATGG